MYTSSGTVLEDGRRYCEWLRKMEIPRRPTEAQPEGSLSQIEKLRAEASADKGYHMASMEKSMHRLATILVVGLPACFPPIRDVDRPDGQSEEHHNIDGDDDSNAASDTDIALPTLDKLVLETPDHLLITFEAADPDGGDLEGCQFTTLLDGVTKNYLIPNDLMSWDGTTGVVSDNSLDEWACDTWVTVEAWIEDARGNRTNTLLSNTELLNGTGLIHTDSGDSEDDATWYGIVNEGDIVCGALSSVSNDGTESTGDRDWRVFWLR